MAQMVSLPGVAVQGAVARPAPRHSIIVRVTHWTHAVSFIALVLSGLGILLAYPRMHWGETGTRGDPALFELPLPFVLDVGLRGPGRYLHFLAAWICLFSGLLYVLSGLYSRHFQAQLWPRASDLAVRPILRVVWGHLRFKRPTEEEARTYNVLQRVSYLAVVFVLTPFMFLTGLAMSPSITSVFPLMVNGLGGHQSARTLHFLAADLLVLFLVLHIAMIILAGFVRRCRAMITGYPERRKMRS